jgi:hypothetical protein
VNFSRNAVHCAVAAVGAPHTAAFRFSPLLVVVNRCALQPSPSSPYLLLASRVGPATIRLFSRPIFCRISDDATENSVLEYWLLPG